VRNSRNDIVDGPFGSELKASEYTSTGVPLVRLQNIERARFVAKNIRYISKAKADTLKRHHFNSGDVIITKLGDPLGKACLVPLEIGLGILVADVVRVRPLDDVVDRRYAMFAINSPAVAAELNSQMKGSTRPRVNLGHIRELSIPLPPLAEQRRIVEKLEALLAKVNACRERLDRIPKLLARFRQSIRSQAVDGNHETVPLVELTHKVGDVDHRMPRNDPNGEIPYISTKDFEPGDEIDFAGAKRISESEFRALSRKISPSSGDVLLSRYGTIGAVIDSRII
jgi:type I restriction enzyme S subunit